MASQNQKSKGNGASGFDPVRSAGIGPPTAGKYTKYGWHGNVPCDAAQLQYLVQSMSLVSLENWGTGGLRKDSSSDSSDDSSSDSTDDSNSDESVVDGAASAQKYDPEEPAGDSKGPGVTIEYVHPNYAEFVAAVKQSPRIKKLQLQELHRSNVFVAHWKPDKHIEAVLKALEEGPSHVEELELFDASWAKCYEYSDRFVQLLQKYSGSLRFLSISNRALVQPNKKNKKQNVMKVVSRMPRLEHLQLLYLAPNLYFYTYRGQFSDARGKAYFTALKNLEVHLRLDWYNTQFLYAQLPLYDPSIADHVYETLTGGDKEENQEEMLEDILLNKRDIISYLDMSVFGLTTYHLPIMDCFADLTELRGIGIRVENVAVTADMVHLEKINVLFHETEEKQAVAAAAFINGEGAAVWSRIRTLNVVPTRYSYKKPAYPVRPYWRCALEAMAAQCCELRRLELGGGADWGAEAVPTLLGNNAKTLEEVVLKDFVASDEILELLKGVPTLRSAKLKRAPGKAGSARHSAQVVNAWAKRGVSLEWL